MAGGYLVSCVPTKGGGPKQRLLKQKRSVAHFLKTHIKQEDQNPTVMVQCFNSNGYHDKNLNGKEAVDAFVEW